MFDLKRPFDARRSHWRSNVDRESVSQPADSSDVERASNEGVKQTFSEPKLSFIEPKLRPHGDLTEVTGFIGVFSP
jgi:hypothetical protein